MPGRENHTASTRRLCGTNIVIRSSLWMDRFLLSTLRTFSSILNPHFLFILVLTKQCWIRLFWLSPLSQRRFKPGYSFSDLFIFILSIIHLCVTSHSTASKFPFLNSFQFTQSSYNVSIFQVTRPTEFDTVIPHSFHMGVPRRPGGIVTFSLDSSISPRPLNHDYFDVRSQPVGDFVFLNITSKSQLSKTDRFRLTQHPLHVKATWRRQVEFFSADSPEETMELESSTRVYINILDRNENCPMFEHSTYNFTVLSNASLLHPLVRLANTDGDSGLHAQRYFAIPPRINGREFPPFRLDPLHGDVYVTHMEKMDQLNMYNDIIIRMLHRGDLMEPTAHCDILSTATLTLVVDSVYKENSPTLIWETTPGRIGKHIVGTGSVIYAKLIVKYSKGIRHLTARLMHKVSLSKNNLQMGFRLQSIPQDSKNYECQSFWLEFNGPWAAVTLDQTVTVVAKLMVDPLTRFTSLPFMEKEANVQVNLFPSKVHQLILPGTYNSNNGKYELQLHMEEAACCTIVHRVVYQLYVKWIQPEWSEAFVRDKPPARFYESSDMMVAPNEYFGLSSNGTIYLQKPLRARLISRIELQYKIHWAGREAQGRVVIHIGISSDLMNVLPLTISNNMSTFHVAENVSIGHRVGQIQVFLDDAQRHFLDETTPFYYEMITPTLENFSYPFQLDPRDPSWIITSTLLDAETMPAMFHVGVWIWRHANDGPTHSRVLAHYQINITDVSEYPPQWVESSCTVFILENATLPRDTLLGLFYAEDFDRAESGRIGNIIYRLHSAQPCFDVDTQGQLFTKCVLHGTHQLFTSTASRSISLSLETMDSHGLINPQLMRVLLKVINPKDFANIKSNRGSTSPLLKTICKGTEMYQEYHKFANEREMKTAQSNNWSLILADIQHTQNVAEMLRNERLLVGWSLPPEFNSPSHIQLNMSACSPPGTVVYIWSQKPGLSAYTSLHWMLLNGTNVHLFDIWQRDNADSNALLRLTSTPSECFIQSDDNLDTTEVNVRACVKLSPRLGMSSALGACADLRVSIYWVVMEPLVLLRSLWPIETLPRLITVSISENEAPGTRVHRVAILEHKKLQQHLMKHSIRYRIDYARSSPGVREHFRLHQQNGGLRLRKSLDREAHSSYTISIWAFVEEDRSSDLSPKFSLSLTEKGESISPLTFVDKEEGSSDAASTIWSHQLEEISVRVVDQNDNAPKFLTPQDSEIILLEDMPSGIYVTTILAEDADEGVNAQLTFQLLPPPSSTMSGECVHVDASSGVVRILGENCLRAGHYILHFQVSDQGNFIATEPLRVRLVILPVHLPWPGPPRLQREYQHWRIWENASVDTLVGQLVSPSSPWKRDSVIHYPSYHVPHRPRQPRFSLLGEKQALSHFHVHPLTGEVRTRALLDRELDPSYWLQIAVSEAWFEPNFSSPPRSEPLFSIVEIYLSVLPVNEYPPIPQQLSYQVTIAETKRSTVKQLLTIEVFDPDSLSSVNTYDEGDIEDTSQFFSAKRSDLTSVSFTHFSIVSGNEFGWFTLHPTTGVLSLVGDKRIDRNELRPQQDAIVLQVKLNESLSSSVPSHRSNSPATASVVEEEASFVRILIHLTQTNYHSPVFPHADGQLVMRAWSISESSPRQDITVPSGGLDNSCVHGGIHAVDYDMEENGALTYLLDRREQRADDIQVDVKPDGTVCFSNNIPLGQYLFKVLAKDTHGLVSSTPLSVSFEVMSPPPSFSSSIVSMSSTISLVPPPSILTVWEDAAIGWELWRVRVPLTNGWTSVVEVIGNETDGRVKFPRLFDSMLVNSMNVSTLPVDSAVLYVQHPLNVTQFGSVHLVKWSIFTQNSGQMTFIIKILTRPVFRDRPLKFHPSNEYTCEVPEDIAMNSDVPLKLMISGYHNEDETLSRHYNLTFSIIDQRERDNRDRHLFSIEPETGQLKISGQLDYEHWRQHRIVVQVENLAAPLMSSNRIAWAQIRIAVRDVNEFSPKWLNVPSNHGLLRLERIELSTNSKGDPNSDRADEKLDKLIQRLLHQGGWSSYHAKSISGAFQIVIPQGQNHEEVTANITQFLAFDPDTGASADIRYSLQKGALMNDWITFNMSIPSHQSSPDAAFKDGKTSLFGDVHSIFSVDSHDGWLRVKFPSDVILRNLVGQIYRLQVRASDQGLPYSRHSDSDVLVEFIASVSGASANLPTIQFSQRQYIVEVASNAGIGSILAQLPLIVNSPMSWNNVSDPTDSHRGYIIYWLEALADETTDNSTKQAGANKKVKRNSNNNNGQNLGKEYEGIVAMDEKDPVIVIREGSGRYAVVQLADHIHNWVTLSSKKMHYRLWAQMLTRFSLSEGITTFCEVKFRLPYTADVFQLNAYGPSWSSLLLTGLEHWQVPSPLSVWLWNLSALGMEKKSHLYLSTSQRFLEPVFLFAKPITFANVTMTSSILVESSELKLKTSSCLKNVLWFQIRKSSGMILEPSLDIVDYLAGCLFHWQSATATNEASVLNFWLHVNIYPHHLPSSSTSSYRYHPILQRLPRPIQLHLHTSLFQKPSPLLKALHKQVMFLHRPDMIHYTLPAYPNETVASFTIRHPQMLEITPRIRVTPSHLSAQFILRKDSLNCTTHSSWDIALAPQDVSWICPKDNPFSLEIHFGNSNELSVLTLPVKCRSTNNHTLALLNTNKSPEMFDSNDALKVAVLDGHKSDNSGSRVLLHFIPEGKNRSLRSDSSSRLFEYHIISPKQAVGNASFALEMEPFSGYLLLKSNHALFREDWLQKDRPNEKPGRLSLQVLIRAYHRTSVSSHSSLPQESLFVFVEVRIDDVNNHSPIFLHTPYHTTVQLSELEKSTLPYLSIFQAKAEDLDQGINSTVRYSLDVRSSEHRRWFEIGSASGEVRINKASYDHIIQTLNRYQHFMMEVYIMAEDGMGRQSDPPRIPLHIQFSLPGAPRFNFSGKASGYWEVTIAEDVEVGTRLVLIQAESVDKHPLLFTLHVPSSFAASYNMGEEELSTLSNSVEEVYDITSSKVNDLDRFTFNVTTGYISVAMELNYTETNEHHVIVRATDMVTNVAAHLHVYIHIAPVSRTAPNFVSSQLLATDDVVDSIQFLDKPFLSSSVWEVSEVLGAGSDLVRLNATAGTIVEGDSGIRYEFCPNSRTGEDFDLDPETMTTYMKRRELSSSLEMFRLDVDKGVISLGKRIQLDYERNTRHWICVNAVIDRKNRPSLSSTHIVQIRVLDVNDNEPQFQQNYFTTALLDSALEGAPVIQLLAIDEDVETTLEYSVGMRNGVDFSDCFRYGEYGLITWFPTGWVVDHSKSQYVSPMECRNYSLSDFMSVNVLVHDGVHSATSELNIRLISDNSYPPQMIAMDVESTCQMCHQQQIFVNEIQFTLPEDTSVSETHSIHILSAVDDDRNKSTFGLLSYRLLGEKGVARSHFQVNPDTGEIFLVRKLNFEKRKKHELLVLVEDGGGLTKFLTVSVFITEVNRFIPQLQLSQYSMNLFLDELFHSKNDIHVGDIYLSSERGFTKEGLQFRLISDRTDSSSVEVFGTRQSKPLFRQLLLDNLRLLYPSNSLHESAALVYNTTYPNINILQRLNTSSGMDPSWADSTHLVLLEQLTWRVKVCHEGGVCSREVPLIISLWRSRPEGWPWKISCKNTVFTENNPTGAAVSECYLINANGGVLSSDLSGNGAWFISNSESPSEAPSIAIEPQSGIIRALLVYDYETQSNLKCIVEWRPLSSRGELSSISLLQLFYQVNVSDVNDCSPQIVPRSTNVRVLLTDDLLEKDLIVVARVMAWDDDADGKEALIYSINEQSLANQITLTEKIFHIDSLGWIYLKNKLAKQLLEQSRSHELVFDVKVTVVDTQNHWNITELKISFKDLVNGYDVPLNWNSLSSSSVLNVSLSRELLASNSHESSVKVGGISLENIERDFSSHNVSLVFISLCQPLKMTDYFVTDINSFLAISFMLKRGGVSSQNRLPKQFLCNLIGMRQSRRRISQLGTSLTNGNNLLRVNIHILDEQNSEIVLPRCDWNITGGPLNMEISENVPPGTLLYTLRTRGSSQLKLQYSLLPIGNNLRSSNLISSNMNDFTQAFILDKDTLGEPGTVQLRVAHSLDREGPYGEFYQFKVRAQVEESVINNDSHSGVWTSLENTLPSSKSYCEWPMLSVRLLDVNDNSPHWEYLNIDPVHENAAVGSLIGQFRAIDPDYGVNARIRYSLLGESSVREKNPKMTEVNNENDISTTQALQRLVSQHLSSQPAYFTVHPRTGVVRVARALDREKQPIHRLVLMIEDSKGLRYPQAVYSDVRLIDINDSPPQFQTDTRLIQIPESVPVGYKLTKVNAISLDEGENSVIRYRLLTDGNGQFRLDAITGELFVASPLDYERNTEYFLTIEAVDGGQPPLSASIVITVKIIDENDNAPQFPSSQFPDVPVNYRFTVTENTPADSVIGKVLAMDMDSGINRLVSYRLLAWGLGRRNISCNGISPEEKANSPSPALFRIHLERGDIIVRQSLDHEVANNYWLCVLATDMYQHQNYSMPNGQHSLSQQKNATALVWITVQDVNDNAPQFQFPQYHMAIEVDRDGNITATWRQVDSQGKQIRRIRTEPRDSPVLIGQLRVTDIDGPNNAAPFVCELETPGIGRGNNAKEQALGALSLLVNSTGVECLLWAQGRLAVAQHIIVVRAYDNGTTPRYNRTTVALNVRRQDNLPPEMVSTRLRITLPPSAPLDPTRVLAQVQVRDRTPYDHLRFVLLDVWIGERTLNVANLTQHGTSEDGDADSQLSWFVDPNLGRITCGDALKTENYTLWIKVMNGSLETNGTITLEVTQITEAMLRSAFVIRVQSPPPPSDSSGPGENQKDSGNSYPRRPSGNAHSNLISVYSFFADSLDEQMRMALVRELRLSSPKWLFILAVQEYDGNSESLGRERRSSKGESVISTNTKSNPNPNTPGVEIMLAVYSPRNRQFLPPEKVMDELQASGTLRSPGVRQLHLRNPLNTRPLPGKWTIIKDICDYQDCPYGRCETRKSLIADGPSRIASSSIRKYNTPNFRLKKECTCRELFHGNLCDQEINACGRHPCRRPQLCQSLGSEHFQCACPGGLEQSSSDGRCVALSQGDNKTEISAKRKRLSSQCRDDACLKKLGSYSIYLKGPASFLSWRLMQLSDWPSLWNVKENELSPHYGTYYPQSPSEYTNSRQLSLLHHADRQSTEQLLALNRLKHQVARPIRSFHLAWSLRLPSYPATYRPISEFVLNLLTLRWNSLRSLRLLLLPRSFKKRLRVELWQSDAPLPEDIQPFDIGDSSWPSFYDGEEHRLELQITEQRDSPLTSNHQPPLYNKVSSSSMWLSMVFDGFFTKMLSLPYWEIGDGRTIRVQLGADVVTNVTQGEKALYYRASAGCISDVILDDMKAPYHSDSLTLSSTFTPWRVEEIHEVGFLNVCPANFSELSTLADDMLPIPKTENDPEPCKVCSNDGTTKCLRSGNRVDQLTGPLLACQCRGGYTGAKCEYDIDECLQNDHSLGGGASSGLSKENEKVNLCGNRGGICVNVPGSYRCQCSLGYGGPQCSTQTLVPLIPDTNALGLGRIQIYFIVGVLTFLLLMAVATITCLVCCYGNQQMHPERQRKGAYFSTSTMLPPSNADAAAWRNFLSPAACFGGSQGTTIAANGHTPRFLMELQDYVRCGQGLSPPETPSIAATNASGAYGQRTPLLHGQAAGNGRPNSVLYLAPNGNVIPGGSSGGGSRQRYYNPTTGSLVGVSAADRLSLCSSILLPSDNVQNRRYSINPGAVTGPLTPQIIPNTQKLIPLQQQRLSGDPNLLQRCVLQQHMTQQQQQQLQLQQQQQQQQQQGIPSNQHSTLLQHHQRVTSRNSLESDTNFGGFYWDTNDMESSANSALPMHAIIPASGHMHQPNNHPTSTGHSRGPSRASNSSGSLQVVPNSSGVPGGLGHYLAAPDVVPCCAHANALPPEYQYRNNMHHPHAHNLHHHQHHHHLGFCPLERPELGTPLAQTERIHPHTQNGSRRSSLSPSRSTSQAATPVNESSTLVPLKNGINSHTIPVANGDYSKSSLNSNFHQSQCAPPALPPRQPAGGVQPHPLTGSPEQLSRNNKEDDISGTATLVARPNKKDREEAVESVADLGEKEALLFMHSIGAKKGHQDTVV